MKKKNITIGGKLQLNKRLIIGLSSTQAYHVIGGDISVTVVKPSATLPKPTPTPTPVPQTNPKPTPSPSPQSFDGGRTCTVTGPENP